MSKPKVERVLVKVLTDLGIHTLRVKYSIESRKVFTLLRAYGANTERNAL
jgi:hypothetical protein